MKNNLLPCPFCGGQASIRYASCCKKENETFILSHRAACDRCNMYFCCKSEFRIMDGQPKFTVNGDKLTINACSRRSYYGLD